MSKDEAMKPVAWTDEDFTQLIVSEDIAKDIGATVPLYTAPPKREPEPEPMECHTCKGLGRIYMGCGSWIHCDTCNTTGKATTQPKREPPCKTGSQCTTKCMECAEPTPVAWLYIQPDNPHLNVHYDDVDVSQFPHDEWFPVYKQPKRTWVGLTDEEIDEGQRQSWVDKQAFESAVWWAEAKLKEKNNV